MNRINIIILLLFINSFLDAEDIEKFSRIAIDVPDRTTLNRIWKTGIDFEGSSGKIGSKMEFIAGVYELQELRKAGISFTVLIDDISKISSDGYASGPANALGFGYGSMGGFYTFDEVVQQLDSMRLLYPTLISQKESIGGSRESRNIWAVKISDNPDLEEDEPEALYTALHHAREPAGMMAVIYYMWWLLENYGSDPDATYLINNRQLWFIPVVNPDGYVYNESLYSPGPPVTYGMWRKNRRNNGSGSYGVDLNRNYGPEYMWDSPYGGSSTSPSSETYRGPNPFSEPEVLAIQSFIWFHYVKICLNYHTYSNLLIYPWGFQPVESEDSMAFREYAFYMVADNRYLSGRDEETVNYVTRGNSDDFMYGDNSKPKVFAMTPEVGATGFWPTTGEILPLAQENLTMNILASYIAGQHTILKSFTLEDENANGYLQGAEDFNLLAKIGNMGLNDAPNIHVEISEDSPFLNFTTTEFVVSNLTSRAESTLTFTGSLIHPENSATRANIHFKFSDSLGYSHYDTITIYIGTPTVILADSGNSGMTNWIVTGDWDLTSVSHSPPYAFTDSPGDYYLSNRDYTLTYNDNLHLYGYDYCVLRFWTKWAVEPTFDFATVEVSTNEGTDWITQKSALSHRGSGRGKQVTGTWGYDGYTPGLDWLEQEIDLTPYLDKTIRLRFKIASDGNSERDGWYIDDIRIYGYSSAIPRLSISDNGSNTEGLIFGEDGTATEGIDPPFGEIELDPKPAPGTFDIRWHIEGTNGTKINYLDTLSPSNQVNTFMAEFQPGPSGYPITIRWDPSILKTGGWRLRDGLTNGMIFNINMWSDTIYAISDTTVKSVEIVHTREDTIATSFAAGWNMLSLPVLKENRSSGVVYPSAITDAFAYAGSYVVAESLDYRQAYWIKFNEAGAGEHIGIPIVRDSIEIPAGWWMISGLACPVISEQMICNPPPCRHFVFRGVYEPESNINSGEGFWLKGPATLTYSCMKPFGAFLKPTERSVLSSYNSLTFSDKNGVRATLYFSDDPDGMHGIPDDYEMPPRPPAEAFDARFTSNNYVENLSQDEKKNHTTILLQSKSSPIKIEWNMKNGGKSLYELSQPSGNNWKYSLNGNGSFTIPDAGDGRLILLRQENTYAPEEFLLGQNYPNPFNPGTTIDFELAQPSIISIKIFNTLGQNIAILADDEKYPAGFFHITFNNTDLPSGVYYYSMTSKNLSGNILFQATKKMILLQ